MSLGRGVLIDYQGVPGPSLTHFEAKLPSKSALKLAQIYSKMAFGHFGIIPGRFGADFGRKLVSKWGNIGLAAQKFNKQLINGGGGSHAPP